MTDDELLSRLTPFALAFFAEVLGAQRRVHVGDLTEAEAAAVFALELAGLVERNPVRPLFILTDRGAGLVPAARELRQSHKAWWRP